MRRGWQGSRLGLLFFCLAVCVMLIALSSFGALAPLEGLLAAPLNWVSGGLNRLGLSVGTSFDELTEARTLREQLAEMETVLSRLQTEVVTLRERASDYTRLADLANYISAVDNQEFLAADVINRDTASTLRTIVINRGTRDGVRVGMAVVTGQGLVGRVIEVTANAARVMLVSSESSAVSARLQSTREEGVVTGVGSGGMRMSMIPLNASVQIGDIVLTSGLGGNLPGDLVIGQVTSNSQLVSGTEQTAEIRSLVDFDRLELVLVITSFEPVDQSLFETRDTGNEDNFVP